VAWVHHVDPPPRPETAAPSATLPHPLELGELGRALAGLFPETASALAAGSESVRQAKLGERLPLRILAADDIRTNREMLRRMMDHLGYQLSMVENGAEVLAAMQQRTFDLILLDVQMPVMDGLTAAREIRRMNPDSTRRPKLVAVTANALPGDRENCLAAGMDDYLSKPVLPCQIETCLLRLFQNSAGAAARNAAGTGSPAPTDPPWVDRAHFETVLPDLTPAEAAETLTELHGAARDDFQHIFPQLVTACRNHDSPRLADLAHGLLSWKSKASASGS
jgi:CheY-like chemotaxis protein